MSTPPPPPYLSAPGPGGPSFGSPGSGQTGGPTGGLTGGQTGGTTGGLTPGAGPPKKSPIRFVVVGVVLAVIAAGIVIWVTRSDDGEAKTLSSKGKGVRTALQALIDDADFNSDGESELGRCPLGRIKQLDVLVSDQVDLGDVSDGDDTSRILDATDVEPQQVQCSQVSATLDELNGVIAVLYAALLDPPPDIDGYLLDVTSAEDSNDPSVGDTVPFEGGIIHRACDGGETIESCYAVWSADRDKVAIEVAMIGGTSEGEVTKALEAVLATVIDNLVES